MYRNYGKRLFDLLLVVPGMLVLSPALAVLALLVYVKLGSPILFRQQRPGLGGEPFTLYKFRTMTDDKDEQGDLLPDNERIVPFGWFLRRFKLDELPQLFNVLRGDMSLVGPRPGLLSQLNEYDELARKRLLVHPGLTGLAQIYGNIYLPWEERWKYDAFYANNISFLMDLKIILKTIYLIIVGEDKFSMPFKEFLNKVETENQAK